MLHLDAFLGTKFSFSRLATSWILPRFLAIGAPVDKIQGSVAHRTPAAIAPLVVGLILFGGYVAPFLGAGAVASIILLGNDCRGGPP
jgi:hypothetical protein